MCVVFLQIEPTHHKPSNTSGECGRVEEDLSVGGKERDEPVQWLLVVHGKELISLIKDQNLTLAHVSDALFHQVNDTARSSNYHVD